MQEFYINKNATLPILRMELIKDGRHNFRKFNEQIQNADIKFSMLNIDTNVYKIINEPCYIKLKDDDEATCDDEYIICYNWKKRDTNEYGLYKGIFTITFLNDLTNQDGTTYNIGDLIMPIREEIEIIIK